MLLRPHGSSRRASARSGFTVVELAVSATVLVVGVLGFLAAVVAGQQLATSTREMERAFQAARARCEEIQSAPIDEAFARFNADPDDDPATAGPAGGATFAIQGFATEAGTEAVGRVVFPTIDDAGTPVLCEAVDDVRWGMPRDLDGDGEISNGALTTAPIVLPVRVSVEWRGARGVQRVELDQVLVRR